MRRPCTQSCVGHRPRGAQGGQPVETASPRIIPALHPRPTHGASMSGIEVPVPIMFAVRRAWYTGTASQSPGTCVAASTGGPFAGGQPQGSNHPSRWLLPVWPAPTFQTARTPDCPTGPVRPQGEAAPDPRGLQGDIQVQDPLRGPVLPQSAWARVVLDVTARGEGPPVCVGRGADFHGSRCPQTGWHRGQGVEGRAGPPHFPCRRPETARAEVRPDGLAHVRGA